jgi:hypothetical protein
MLIPYRTCVRVTVAGWTRVSRDDKFLGRNIRKEGHNVLVRHVYADQLIIVESHDIRSGPVYRRYVRLRCAALLKPFGSVQQFYQRSLPRHRNMRHGLLRGQSPRHLFTTLGRQLLAHRGKHIPCVCKRVISHHNGVECVPWIHHRGPSRGLLIYRCRPCTRRTS